MGEQPPFSFSISTPTLSNGGGATTLTFSRNFHVPARLKKFPPSAFSNDIWRAIEMILWREEIQCMPKGSATDGLAPEEIETTKHGVEIRGGIWFLLGGRSDPNPRYEMTMCLSRPRFSSIESVTVDKLESATISDSEFDEGHLTLTVT